jgi:hypothetical protein
MRAGTDSRNRSPGGGRVAVAVSAAGADPANCDTPYEAAVEERARWSARASSRCRREPEPPVRERPSSSTADLGDRYPVNHFDYRDGVLHAEDVPIPTIAEAVGTPFYCYSTATLTRHYTSSRRPSPSSTRWSATP